MEMEPWDFGTLELEDTAKKLNFPSLVKYFERKGGNKVENPNLVASGGSWAGTSCTVR